MKRYIFCKYVIFCFILLLGILAFYLSCKSKSPTESTSALNGQLAGQNANNTTQTTTSSSITTTVKPGSSPPNTTTLITSRTLTSTSTRTTTTATSTTSTTTTSRKVTTTTTRRPTNLLWCSFHVMDWNGREYDVNDGDTIPGSAVSITKFYPRVQNVGTNPIANVTVTLRRVTTNPSFPVTITDNSAILWAIQNDGICVPIYNASNDCITIEWGFQDPVPTGSECTVTFRESYSGRRFSFTIIIGGPR